MILCVCVCVYLFQLFFLFCNFNKVPITRNLVFLLPTTVMARAEDEKVVTEKEKLSKWG